MQIGSFRFNKPGRVYKHLAYAYIHRCIYIYMYIIVRLEIISDRVCEETKKSQEKREFILLNKAQIIIIFLEKI
jgi:hypothetical protein